MTAERPAVSTLSSARRAVLTGLGILNPLGLTPETFWEALAAGKSGIRPIRSFDAAGLPTRIGGEVQGFDAKKHPGN